MNDFGNVLQIALSVAAIVSIGGVGYLRGTIINLRGTLVDVRSDLSDADRKIVLLESGREADGKVMEQQRRDLEALARLKTGEEHWLELGTKLEIHHSEAKTHWEIQEAQSATMVDGLIELAHAIAVKDNEEGQ